MSTKCAILRDAAVRFSISTCDLMSARTEIKDNDHAGVYKILSGERCEQLTIQDLNGYSENLGIKGIRERLESSGEGLDLVALHCKEFPEGKVDLIAEKEFLDGFGKKADEVNEMFSESLGFAKKEVKGLDQKMVKLDALIYFHLEFRQIADAVTLILGQCKEEMIGDLTQEKVNELELSIAKLSTRKEKLLDIKLKSIEKHYFSVHKDETRVINQQFDIITLQLARAKELQKLGLGFSIQSLFIKLDQLCDRPSFDLSNEAQKAFIELPSKLRELILKKAEVFLEKCGTGDNSRMQRIERAEAALFSDAAADLPEKGEVRSNNRMQRIERAEAALNSNGSSNPPPVSTKRRLRTLSTPHRSGQLSGGGTGIRFHDRNGLKEQASTPIEKLFADPKSALSAMTAALREFPGNYLSDVKIMEIVDKRCGKDVMEPVRKATGIAIQPESQTILKNLPGNFYGLLYEDYFNKVFKSLHDFRNDVRLLTAYKGSMDLTQIQSIAELLLNGARKGELKLHGFRGVYHWVSLLANNMGPSSVNHGEKIVAEDVDRLLVALNKVIDLKPEDYSDCIVTSLGCLKSEVEFVAKGKWNETDKKTIIQFLLNGAKRGGVDLDNPKGVYYFVWFLAHEKDKNAGGNNYGLNHAADDLDQLISAIDKAINLLPIPKPQDYSNCVISSLVDLKNMVQKAMNQKWKDGEMEIVLQFLLEGAKRGNVALENPNGVYYFVWFLAHEKDKNAGGPNFGRINAPKDAMRLVLAIDKTFGV